MGNRYSIKMAAQMSGISPYVIRAWEKRYEVVSPQRSEGNQRLYSEQDVNRLKLLATGIQSGRRIGELVKLTQTELENLLPIGESGSSPVSSASNLVEDCIQAVIRTDTDTLEDILVNSTIEHGIIRTIDSLVTPLMDRFGQEWHQGHLRIFHEHLASSVLRTFLGNQIRSFDLTEDALSAVVATPSGQIHELGSLVAAVAAASAGFRVLYLGSSLPASEIIQSVKESGASLLLISIVFPGSTAGVRREVDQLRQYLPESCRMILGGSSSAPFLTEGNEGAPRSMLAFRERLLEIRRDSLTR